MTLNIKIKYFNTHKSNDTELYLRKYHNEITKNGKDKLSGIVL